LQTLEKIPKNKAMKKILFISIILSLFVLISGFLIIPQNTSVEDYDKSWIKVEKHVHDGLPKSALENVEGIYQLLKNHQRNLELFLMLFIKKQSQRTTNLN